MEMIASFEKTRITISNILPLEDDDLQGGLFIVAINFYKIPPHLVLLFNGKYYDLTFKGVNIKSDFDPLYAVIKSKFYPTLFFKCPIEFDNENDVFDFIDRDFKKIIQIDGQNVTCLNPIKEAIINLMDLDVDSHKVETIFDFIEILNDNYVISDTFICNPVELTPSNSLVWNKYSRQQLNVSLASQQ